MNDLPSGGRQEGLRPPAVTQPHYAALDLVASPDAPVAARRWLDRVLVDGAVAPWRRGELRRVCTELAREGVRCADAGACLRLEADVVGPVARLSVTAPASTLRLGARVVEGLRSAFEWGVEQVPGRGRQLWCHVELAA